MNIAQQITDRITSIKAGKIVGYNYFNIPDDKFDALAAALTRLTQKGTIKRLAKGMYYKPEQSIFGELSPKEDQILKQYLFKDGKRIGYLTGYGIYNKMMLTTQMANTYFIASMIPRKKVTIGRVKIKFVKAYTKVLERDIPYLQFLDAVKDIKHIPDNDVNTLCKILIGKLRAMKKTERQRIYRLSFFYPPATRALTGAFLDLMEKANFTKELKRTLNGLSQYQLSIRKEVLPTKENWNIK